MQSALADAEPDPGRRSTTSTPTAPAPQQRPQRDDRHQAVFGDRAKQVPVRSTKSRKPRTNPLPPSAFPPESISTNAGRVAEQEISRTTQRVVRIRGLSDRRTGIEVVVLVARWAAAAERATLAARPRAAAAIVVATAASTLLASGPALPVVANARTVIHVAIRMAIPVAAPIWRATRRAIVRPVRVTRATLLGHGTDRTRSHCRLGNCLPCFRRARRSRRRILHSNRPVAVRSPESPCGRVGNNHPESQHGCPHLEFIARQPADENTASASTRSALFILPP